MGEREHVIAIRRKYPCATLQQIGDKCGITRERARQILQTSNMNTKAERKPPQLYACLQCGKPTMHRKYCSRECQKEYNHPLVECENCHNLFRRIASQIVYNGGSEHFYCSRECYRKSGLHGRRRILPYEGMIKLITKEYTRKQIAEKLSITIKQVNSMISTCRKRGTLVIPLRERRGIYDKKEIIRLYNNGYSYQEIADEMNGSYHGIANAIFRLSKQGLITPKRR